MAILIWSVFLGFKIQQNQLADNEELCGTAFSCGNDLRQKHLDAARIIAVRRLREAGQLEPAARLDAATIGFGWCGGMGIADGSRMVDIEWGVDAER